MGNDGPVPCKALCQCAFWMQRYVTFAPGDAGSSGRAGRREEKPGICKSERWIVLSGAGGLQGGISDDGSSGCRDARGLKEGVQNEAVHCISSMQHEL